MTVLIRAIEIMYSYRLTTDTNNWNSLTIISNVVAMARKINTVIPYGDIIDTSDW